MSKQGLLKRVARTTCIVVAAIALPTIVFACGQVIFKIEKSGPATVNRGDTFTYTLKITEMGTGLAVNTTVQDVIPSGLQFLGGFTVPTPGGARTHRSLRRDPVSLGCNFRG